MKIGLCKVAFLIFFAFNSFKGMAEKKKKITTIPELDLLSNNIKKLNIFLHNEFYLSKSVIIVHSESQEGNYLGFSKTS